ncbi:MAG: response regulator transcription factor [Thermomicrobiales bacterium]
MLAHALNNVGCAKLNRGDPRGGDDLERSMEVARAANLEEHVGRAYANLASMAIGEFQFARAERWLEEGIAYTLDHDVETYRLCLLSWQPVQLFFQGRWSEATDAAAALLSRSDLSPLNGLQPLDALGRIRARRGDPEVGAALDKALAAAGPTMDPSRRGPVRAAWAEAAWLTGDLARAAAEAEAAYGLAIDLDDRWLIGELAFWLWRTGHRAPPPAEAAEPFALQIAGGWAGAAAWWQASGCPYEAAQALADSGDEGMLRHALAEFVRLGARPMAAVVVHQLRGLGARGIPRGPRPATRANPANLTPRELEILPLLAAGRRDADIAGRLFLSARTVGHHVGNILLKLDVHARGEVADAAQRLGIPLPSVQDRVSDPPT